jgi:hypothetical protein
MTNGPGFFDADDAWVHGEDDEAAPGGRFSDLLNRGLQAIKNVAKKVAIDTLAEDDAPAQAAAVAVTNEIAGRDLPEYRKEPGGYLDAEGGLTFEDGRHTWLTFNKLGAPVKEIAQQMIGVYVDDDEPRWAFAVHDERGRVHFGVEKNSNVFPATSSGGSTGVRKVAVFPIYGQSNPVGRAQPYSPLLDPSHPRVREFRAGELVPAGEPLTHLGVDGTPGVGPGFMFGKLWADAHPDWDVVLVGCAWGGTGFTTSSGGNPVRWAIDTPDPNNLPNLARTKVQQAIAAIAAEGDLPQVMGVLWHQGESDTGLSEATYAGYLDALIDRVRTDYGNPALPFLVGQLNPENTGEIRNYINRAHINTPKRKPYTAFARVDRGGHMPDDFTHFNRVNQHKLAERWATQEYERALLNIPGSPAFEPQDLTARRIGGDVLVSWQMPWGRATGFVIEWRADGGEWTAANVTHDTALAIEATIAATGTVIDVRVKTLVDATESPYMTYSL